MRTFKATSAGLCAVAVIAGAALAGCAVSQPGAFQPSRTQPRVNCGSAATHFLDDSTQMLSASSGALRCFDAAVTHCRAAAITVTAMGVDAGTRYNFIIEPKTHPCEVTEQSEFYLVSGGPHNGPVTTVGCQHAAAAASGVTLSCDGREILIPATVSSSEAAS